MIDPHAPSADLAYLDGAAIRRAFADGSLTSRDLVTTLLDRIAALDDATGAVGVNALAAVAADALAQADRADERRARGDVLGPLDGLPVLIKDNIEAEGLPGVAGATALVGRPSRDAALVTRLRDAGAVVLGSTNLSQWANIRSSHSTSGYSATGGLVANPWALARSAGGSSSGAGAALAAGFAPLSVGTETNGSIVCPSSFNGVVGLKPGVGRVPTDAVVPISRSMDSPGPLARCVDDVADLFAVLSNEPAPDAVAPGALVEATNWRTGHPATDATFSAFVEAWRSRGVTIGANEFAWSGPQQYDDGFTVILAELHDDLGDYLATRPGEGVRSLADVIAFEDEHAAVEQRYFGHDLLERALATGGRAGEAYAPARARSLEWMIEQCLEPGLGEADVIVSPAMAPAFRSDLVLGDLAFLVSPAVNAAATAGWPIVCVPIGLVHDLPVGLTLVGRPGSEWRLLEVARHVEELARDRGWTGRPSWADRGSRTSWH